MEDNLDKLRGLFEGGNFPNAQINVLTGDGVQISYESAKKTEKEPFYAFSYDTYPVCQRTAQQTA